MIIEILWHEDMWMHIKKVAFRTISKNTNTYPTSEWKTKILKARHSPIRLGMFIIQISNIPNYIATHLTRHHEGIEKFVESRREDKGYNQTEINRLSPVNLIIWINFEAIIEISKKRLCNNVDAQTKKVWKYILETINPYEPELFALCHPRCWWEKQCNEFNPCQKEIK